MHTFTARIDTSFRVKTVTVQADDIGQARRKVLLTFAGQPYSSLYRIKSIRMGSA